MSICANNASASDRSGASVTGEGIREGLTSRTEWAKLD